MRVELDLTQPDGPEAGQVWISTVIDRVVALVEKAEPGYWRIEEAGRCALGVDLIDEGVLLERYRRVGRLAPLHPQGEDGQP